MTPERLRVRLVAEDGMTIIEVVFACSLLMIVAIGLAGLSAMATKITENEGHLSARTAEYSVDKMEQLLQLTYADTQSNTTVFPSTTSGGTGLNVGGSSDTTAPVAGYADYLDADGNPLCTTATPCTATPPSTWYYMRAWQVSLPAGTSNLKQITVTATIRTSVANAVKASSTITAYKTNCVAGC